MNKIVLSLLSLLLVVGCGNDPSVDDQIADYISESGLVFETSPTGLRYVVNNPDEGEFPIANSLVTIIYNATLTDGSALNSSNGSSIETYATGGLEGIAESLKLLKPGGSGTFLIPPDLGYGEEQIQDIPGNSVLVYEIQMVSIDNQIQDDILEYIEENNLDAVETEDGLFHIITEPGNDQMPNLNSQVNVNYTGKLLNGSVFDSGTDVSFVLSNLIRGWQLGIPLLGEGGSGTFIVPPQLGYGFNGTGGIPGNSILVFDIDLIAF